MENNLIEEILGKEIYSDYTFKELVRTIIIEKTIGSKENALQHFVDNLSREEQVSIIKEMFKRKTQLNYKYPYNSSGTNFPTLGPNTNISDIICKQNEPLSYKTLNTHNE